MKKFISLFLSFIVICMLTMPSVGAVKKSELDSIKKAIAMSEDVKTEFGLNEIDYSKLTYSDSIIAYDYTDAGLVQNSEFFPIKYKNDLIGWVIKVEYNAETLYQFSVVFVDDVNCIVNDDMSFAFIYDYNYCYMYDGTHFYILNEISLKTENREIINTERTYSFSNIKLNNFDNTYYLNYNASNVQTRAQSYYSCGVSFVTQNPVSNICWAASTACITNYLLGGSRTAISVAQDYYGTSNYNQGLTLTLQDDVLNSYGLNYSYRSQVPTDGIIYKNITRDFPIQATFVWNAGFHIVVIYGCNIISGYISVMDPEFGFCRASYSSSDNYVYVSGWSGVTLTLYSAACRYWTN